jgi:hypothetical protein
VAPKTQKKIHWSLALLWFAFFFVIVWRGWENSVPLLVFISVYANFVGHVSSAQAAQVEVRQEAQEKSLGESSNQAGQRALTP